LEIIHHHHRHPILFHLFFHKKTTLNHLQEQSLQYFQNLKIYGSITITTTCIPSKQTRISQLPQRRRRRRPNTNATQSLPWPFRCAKSCPPKPKKKGHYKHNDQQQQQIKTSRAAELQILGKKKKKKNMGGGGAASCDTPKKEFHWVENKGEFF
jgi:hypothetical protein